MQTRKVTDVIIVSVMDKRTGTYQALLATNRHRWSDDKANLHEGSVMRIEVFKIGILTMPETYYSIEEFEGEK
jgi:hypothetical protein